VGIDAQRCDDRRGDHGGFHRAQLGCRGWNSNGSPMSRHSAANGDARQPPAGTPAELGSPSCCRKPAHGWPAGSPSEGAALRQYAAQPRSSPVAPPPPCSDWLSGHRWRLRPRERVRMKPLDAPCVGRTRSSSIGTRWPGRAVVEERVVEHTKVLGAQTANWDTTERWVDVGQDLSLVAAERAGSNARPSALAARTR